jgi:hypothetical protein
VKASLRVNFPVNGLTHCGAGATHGEKESGPVCGTGATSVPPSQLSGRKEASSNKA